MMKIRRAKIEDLETIQQLGLELLEYERERWDKSLDVAWPFSENGEKAYRKAIEEKFVILAEAQEGAVGFLIGSISRPKEGDARQTVSAYLNNVYVRETERGRGVGDRFVEEFRQYCLGEGVEKIDVMVNAKNDGAIRFYEKEGFLPSRMLMSKSLMDAE